jgi:hypothetical protein
MHLSLASACSETMMLTTPKDNAFWFNGTSFVVRKFRK